VKAVPLENGNHELARLIESEANHHARFLRLKPIADIRVAKAAEELWLESLRRLAAYRPGVP
jgi:hypothetical protein